ncbi:hypothetical protein BpHYR1_031522 [Brachionus plicatilis]|uniref:Uncharacterized protein n=1 Tax=Brachionus plicatilis TaxID=10195 RepID=A0A3M7T1V2_BRAPC|nr:hypothetical protein BpHYR1_031522 [Brachionus plicatilis]
MTHELIFNNFFLIASLKIANSIQKSAFPKRKIRTIFKLTKVKTKKKHKLEFYKTFYQIENMIIPGIIHKLSKTENAQESITSTYAKIC